MYTMYGRIDTGAMDNTLVGGYQRVEFALLDTGHMGCSAGMCNASTGSPCGSVTPLLFPAWFEDALKFFPEIKMH